MPKVFLARTYFHYKDTGKPGVLQALLHEYLYRIQLYFQYQEIGLTKVSLCPLQEKTVLPKGRTAYIPLAAETANLAENLPDGAAFGVAVVFIEEEKHLADLLFRIRLARTEWIVTDL